ncbi:MAG TPA: L,D-transpeptidase [Firmicutes bacterium]|nr:L,D-transpeptidase [Bacillota bacterium]
MKLLTTLVFLICFSPGLSAKELKFLEVYFRHSPGEYIVFADKKDKKLYLVNRNLKAVRIYNISTGKDSGNKIYRGDNRTPEGAYRITQIWEYEKPQKLLDMEQSLEKSKKGTDAYKKLEKNYAKELEKYTNGRASLERMNNVYFKASEGHSKWGREEDLGRNAYGPVFMRLSFPNENDRKRHEDAKAKGLVPKNNMGRYLPPGSGIAVHGTNDPASLGNNASSGCIRMLNSDVLELREYLDEGSIVVIR